MSLSRSSVLWTAASLLLAAGGTMRAQATAPVRPPLLAPDAYRPSHNPNHPAWVDEALEPANRAHITRIVEGKADVVLLDGGLYQGFRTGVNCVVTRKNAQGQDEAIVWLVVVASEENRCAALIHHQLENVTPMPGNEVRVSSMSLQ
jgi:hypothetical protein